MGVWLVSADVLAASRFTTSPLMETVNALGVLAARNPQPWERDWLARHSQAFQDRVKSDPFSAALARGMQSGEWLPVDLSAPPRPGDVTFEQELDRVRSVPSRVAKFDLAQSAGGRLPDALDVSDPAGAFADLVQWTWDHAVRAEWPRRKRKYEADIVSRITVLGQGGWAAAIGGLAPEVRWLGDGQLQITVKAHPPIDLSHAELMFIPSSLRDWRVAWEYPARFAIIYPAAGMLAYPAAPLAPSPAAAAARADQGADPAPDRHARHHHAAGGPHRARARDHRGPPARTRGRGAGRTAPVRRARPLPQNAGRQPATRPSRPVWSRG